MIPLEITNLPYYDNLTLYQLRKLNKVMNKMTYLLRTLIILMMLGIGLTILAAHDIAYGDFGHIKIAIPAFIYTIFAQAFVMFYFIGVARFVQNIYTLLNTGKNLDELFDEAPEDLTPYITSVSRLNYAASLGKRQTVPWSILILVLGMIAFLLGGAHDTGVVSKVIHSGVVYGFTCVSIIGFLKQWKYLGKANTTLRKIKGLFQIPDGSM